DRAFEMSGMVEKPDPDSAPSNYAITGRYILQPEIFNLLEYTPRGAGGEIQLTDAMDALMREQPFFAYAYEGVSHDCGDKLGWLKANVALALKHERFAGPMKDFLKTTI
ncbi:MAG: sugar phosphate nucleotidyltransferase, partial [Pseudomonadota bacterium]